MSVIDRQNEVEDLKFQIDVLMRRLNDTHQKMDDLAVRLESARFALMFESSAYTPLETKPVNWFSIVDCEEVQAAEPTA